jgi:hypothetical protein
MIILVFAPFGSKGPKKDHRGGYGGLPIDLQCN